uniref:Alkylated DNA repair protein AlkB homolog 8 n=1 Tax=Tanacetum cinerariifolium TaxID=118510 RepID=A0A699GJY6_TANCI|nr:alkylated DNA repair protein AlkB homolog 8 [Tanacetum cinerariifolium]
MEEYKTLIHEAFGESSDEEDEKPQFIFGENPKWEHINEIKVYWGSVPSSKARRPIELMSRGLGYLHNDTEAKIPVYLSPGSLLLIFGDARYQWKHEINRKPGFQKWDGLDIDQQRRTSITLRKLCNNVLDSRGTTYCIGLVLGTSLEDVAQHPRPVTQIDMEKVVMFKFVICITLLVIAMTGNKGEIHPTRSNLLEENCLPKSCLKEKSRPICPPPGCSSAVDCGTYCGAPNDAYCIDDELSRSGPLVWQGSAINRVFADVDSLSWTFLGPRKACHTQVLLSFRASFSSVVTYASATFPCIGRLVERLKRPFFWIDVFACPALFPWHTGKSVSMDVIPKSFEFSPEHYATLVAYPALFHKYPEPFICLVGMSRHVVSLLPVAPDRSLGELKASVDKLIDERGSGEQAEQGDSTSGGHSVGIDVVAETIVEDKLRDDYEAPGGPTVGGKSQSSIQRLLAGAVQNAKVSGGIMPTMPFVSSFVSTTPELDDGDHIKLLAGANIRAIEASQRFVISSDSSDHSGVNIAKAEVDSVVRTSMPIITSSTTTTTTPTADPVVIAKEKLVASYVFGVDSPSAGGSHPICGGFLIVLNVMNGSCLDDGGVCCEMVDGFAPLKIFTSIHGMDHDQIFTEFNVEAAAKFLLARRDEEIKNLKVQLLLKEAKAAKTIRLHVKTSKLKAAGKSFRDEVTALNERNTILEKERNVLDVNVTDLQALVVDKDRELTDSAAQLTSIKSHNDNFAVRYDAQLKVVNDKFDKLYADFVEVTLHLEERFYPYLLTTIAGRRWLLTHGMELAISKCLNSPEYLSALGTAVSKAIEKVMQDGLAAGIIRGREGRVLTNVAAHNPAAEADYVSALQQLQTRLGLNESQPHADQLMVPIHHSPDKTGVGASALSLALDVSDAHVWRIRENIMSHRSLFQDVFIPLAEPLSAAALTDMEGTFGAAPATADLTIALSITFAFAGTVTPLFVDDYGVMGMDDQSAVNESVVDEDANPFPNVDDAELNIP